MLLVLLCVYFVVLLCVRYLMCGDLWFFKVIEVEVIIFIL